MATVNLGRIKPVFRGAYAGGTAYVVDDIVTSGNETFICIQASTGNATTSATHWTKLAAKGTDGTNGTDVGTVITTQGDMLYRDGSGLQRLAKGTASQVLAMNAGATAPEWVAQSGGRTLQMKALYFDDQINYSSNSWGDHSHPLGDGTIQITPKATGNLIRLEMNTNNTGGDKINYDAQGGNTERSRLVITEIDMTGSDFTSGAL